MPPDVVCRITQSQPPLRTRASHPHAGCAGLQPAYSDTPPGSAGFQPASSDMPRGCAGVQPACRERGLPACLSDMPRLGARASSPHAGSAGVSPAYSDTPPGYAGFQPASGDMPRGCAGVQPACRERGLPACLSDMPRLGAQASSPHAGSAGFQRASAIRPTWARGRPARMLGARTSSLPQRYAPPGCAGVSSACWVRGLAARIQRYTTWVRGLPARIPRHTTWVRGRLARMLGTRASSPHTAIHHLGAQASSPPTTPHLGARASSPHTVIHHLGARASRPHAGCTGFQPAYDAPPRSTGVQPAYHGSGNGFLISLSHPDKCLNCRLHKRADSILQQWLKRCQRFADRFAFTLSQITFPLLRP